MNGLRSRVAKKAQKFIKTAQQAPVPKQDVGPPTPGSDPAAPPAPGAPAPAPAAPKPPVPSPPGGKPPAPGAPPQQKTKDEIEQDVERDIRQKKEQEQKIKDLDDKVDGISDQMEGLTKSINKLVNIMQKDTGAPTDFENKFEELKEKEEDGEMSSNEFGVTTNERLITSKEGQEMSVEKLRKARKDRLQAKELEFHEKNPPNKKYKQQVPPPQMGKIKSEPEDWGQYRLKAADMAMDLNASGNEWSVVNKHTDQVFYVIRPTEDTQERFASEDFAHEVIADVRELGVEKAMEKWSALPFEDMKKEKEEKKDDEKPKIMKKLLDKKKEEKKPMLPKKDDESMDEEACGMKATADEEEPVAEEEVAEEPAEEAAPIEEPAPVEEPQVQASENRNDFRRRFTRAFRLALSAQQKNIIENPLKAAFFDILDSMNIENAENLIEAAFSRAASEHFEVAMAKTAEYLEMGDESFVELENQIGELSTRPPATEEEYVDSERKEHAAAMRARASRMSLPLVSDSDHAPADKFESLKLALPKPKLHGLKNLS